ncbi:MAG TPA: DUF3459 domain-containing protein, partial [Devosia sp.]|nr:DUF3459 domain-containing protein [Devosia sp.]
WLPLAADASRNNVAAQREDPQSMLSLYRALIHLRKTELTLRMGDHQAISQGDDVLAYARQLDQRELLVLLNFGTEERQARLATGGKILLSTGMDRQEQVRHAVRLRPNEGLVIATESRT